MAVDGVASALVAVSGQPAGCAHIGITPLGAYMLVTPLLAASCYLAWHESHPPVPGRFVGAGSVARAGSSR